ncbi:DNA gyrase subunit A [Pseudoflavonifractor sp. MSJ-37]|uniref:DNA gyrase subunit A n=1 Tax=Pseudoflavonifractor sp. MSJ-37 TaxID=2841531 RepID=UPI001C108F13|nr:DNA gyrase subunit A [Pseudoflavonifractor sp. MSJ-37]MBU5435384.1 DNA gyrase subunit A [Pseudoflavonifractor sp. MSJ-37]
MASNKRNHVDPEEFRFPDQVIHESPLVPEMEQSYIEYAMSVIKGRALPDVRDGLKPVHRRILYAMYEDNLTHDKPFKKSATCVGDVLGRYHPHGDASVYDAMVRLAQDFSMRYMLVDGHGNFGSVDGDPPAAYRYTEARLSKISEEMLRDIEKDTVDWDPNFDESRKEPRVLPCRFPNLLVNGSSGIAVGMATNIPPHNLREVIGACIQVLDDPESTLADLMEHVKGPDFPTSGIIMGRSGIRAAYATGRGKVIIRARAEFEEFGKDRTRIVVTEIPYQVNKRQLIKNMADQVEDKRLQGISDIRDETDRNGMRIVIELKRDANPQVVLNRLFAQTQLQSSFAINMLALVDDQSQPKILSLRHIIDEYLKFQEEIIVRRTRYDLKKAQERAHLLEGLLIAQDHIDEVIRTIRESYDDAKENLMARFSLDDIQAQAILDMRLKALQGLDREKLENEYRELEARIAYYEELLASDEKIRGVLKTELQAIADKYGDERKTEIQDVEDEIDIEDLIEEEECVFTLTSAGYIKRLPASTYRAQRRGGKGISAQTLKEEDMVETVFTASTHDFILFFTNKGRVHRKKGYQIPEAGRTAKGTNIVNVLPVESDEKVTAMIHLREFPEDRYLVMVTRKGTVKRIQLSSINTARKAGIRCITLPPDDELIAVRETDGDQAILIATHEGMSICFQESDVRCMGRDACGVLGIRLRQGDYVIGAARAKRDHQVLMITENGFGKRTDMDEYIRGDGPQKRGGYGLKGYQVTAKTGPVAAMKVVSDDDDILIISDDGTIIRTHAAGISIYSRAAQGVKVMSLNEGVKVISIARTEHEDEEALPAEGEAAHEVPAEPTTEV